MIKGDIPIVGGMYFTKSVPPEPLLYKGIGKGHFADWKMGDKVWVDGLPFGFTLIHGNIIRELWKDAPEYICNGIPTRRVFNNPGESWMGEDGWITSCGTSDLEFCQQIIKKNILTRAGFPEIAKKEFPFLVDTDLFVRHISPTGMIYPIELPESFLKKEITWKEALRRLTA